MPRRGEVHIGTIYFQEEDENYYLLSGVCFFNLPGLNLCWQTREHMTHGESSYLPRTPSPPVIEVIEENIHAAHSNHFIFWNLHIDSLILVSIHPQRPIKADIL